MKEVSNAFARFPKTSSKDRMDITFAYEANDKDSLNPRLFPIYDLVKTSMNQIENTLRPFAKEFAEWYNKRN